LVKADYRCVYLMVFLSAMGAPGHGIQTEARFGGGRSTRRTYLGRFTKYEL